MWQGINDQKIQGSEKTKLPKNQWLIDEIANELNRAFSKEQVQIAKNHTKKCSTPWPLKVMQIKAH
jgi:hypothetical protein